MAIAVGRIEQLTYGPGVTGVSRVVTPMIMVRDRWVPDCLSARIMGYDPKTEFGRLIQDVAAALPNREMAAELISRDSRIVVIESELRAVIRRGRASRFWNGVGIEDYGVVSRKVVTTAGVGFLVDALQALATLSNLKYHGFGTDATAESSSQTALIAELTTEYASNNTRPTGTQTEQSANIYKTIATLSPDADVTIEEHGLFDQAANSGGTLWDRSLTLTKELASGLDSLQMDYRATFAAGG